MFFREKDHTYLDIDGKVLNSVSKIAGHFHKGFDDDFMSSYKAFKTLFPKLLAKAKYKFVWSDPKIIDWMFSQIDFLATADIATEKQRWLDEWEKSSEYGTNLHLMHEKAALDRGWEINPIDGQKYHTFRLPSPDTYDNHFYLDEALKQKRNIFIPEAMVGWDDDWGQIDRLFLYWNGYKHIGFNHDWKTDKEISDEVWFDQIAPKSKKKKPRMFFGEFNFLPDTTYNYYLLKMSIYNHFLRKHGVDVVDTRLHHVPKKGTAKDFVIKDSPHFAETALLEFKKYQERNKAA